jgi:hypothetical protein
MKGPQGSISFDQRFTLPAQSMGSGAMKRTSSAHSATYCVRARSSILSGRIAWVIMSLIGSVSRVPCGYDGT